MNWFKHLKKASGHGDTLHGQKREKDLESLKKKLSSLKTMAIQRKIPILPRWEADVRHSILTLPASQKIESMSEYEMLKLMMVIDKIEEKIKLYSSSRMSEILGNANNS